MIQAPAVAKKLIRDAGCTLGEDVFDGCGLVFVYSAAGSPAEAYCSDPAHSNCVFVQE